MLQGVVLFPSTHFAIQAEKLIKKQGSPIKLIPVPRHLSSDCGICLLIPWEKKDEILSGEQLSPILVKMAKANDVNDFIATNYLLLSKKFATSPYNDIGLSHWGEINPKTARAKAYLVLKKHGKPLHFNELAELINLKKFDEKQVYPQTIHNELIKDNRFVLVGRGIYALKEHGYQAGTAKDVLRKILKENGPLNIKDIMKEIGKQRILRENTIIINLHNKKYFKKLPDSRYQAV